MNGIMTNNLTLSLTTNYLEKIDADDNLILKSYLSLNQTLLNHIQSNIDMKNVNYLKFIITYGYQTIGHIFKLLLQYTKSLEMAIHHSEKSILFYVEFITQIGDENHTFLQLNSKDAIIFLYKKTLFELDEDYVSSFTESIVDKDKINNLHLLSNFIITVLQYNLNNFKTMDELIKGNIEIDNFMLTHYSKIKTNIELYISYISLNGENHKTLDDLFKYIIKLTKKTNPLLLTIINNS